MAIDNVNDLTKQVNVIDPSIEVGNPNEKIDIEMLEDGGAEIDFDPNQSVEQEIPHDANLADFVEEDELSLIASDLTQTYEDYRAGRREWEQTYTRGLDLLGFKYENRSEPFQGASGATHPVLAESVTQFQALAYKELLPASGPVRTQIMGAVNPESEKQSARVKDFMNYQLMIKMKEYEPEFDQPTISWINF